MLTQSDHKRIRDSLQGRAHPLQLTFHAGEDATDFAAALEHLATELTEAGGERVVLNRGDGSAVVSTPALTISRQDCGVIHYLALPEGPEAAPFLQAVTAPIEPSPELPDDVRSGLQQMTRPVELIVFIAAACPHCPQAVGAANTLALSSANISTTIIDAQRFASLAERFKVRSVPATLIDRGLCITGVVAAPELAGEVLSRDAPQYRARVLNSLAQSGRFDEATQLALSDRGPELVFELWRQSSTSTRMGLMLVAEQALEQNPAALNGIVSQLASVLESEDPALRGDTADLLGKIGHPHARGALQALLSDPNPDVAEIAEEALEALG